MSDIYKNLEILPIDLQGWNGNNQIFEKLILEKTPKVIIEVGTWKGQSAITMGETIKRNNIDCKIYCVDTWLGASEFLTNLRDTPERNLLHKNGFPQVYYQFLSNVVHSGLQDIITPIPNTSRIGYEVLRFFNIKADLIYIDASHSYDDVKDDIMNYVKLLNPGGIIFGDDYKHWEGVKMAVDEIFGIGNFELFEGNFWIKKI